MKIIAFTSPSSNVNRSILTYHGLINCEFNNKSSLYIDLTSDSNISRWLKQRNVWNSQCNIDELEIPKSLLIDEQSNSINEVKKIVNNALKVKRYDYIIIESSPDSQVIHSYVLILADKIYSLIIPLDFINTKLFNSTGNSMLFSKQLFEARLQHENIISKQSVITLLYEENKLPNSYISQLSRWCTLNNLIVNTFASFPAKSLFWLEQGRSLIDSEETHGNLFSGSQSEWASVTTRWEMKRLYSSIGFN